ncbi:MAG: C13 family peptidase, partial [Myxococcota bacterium]
AGAGFTPIGRAERVQALVVSTSIGWENYRHQADALSAYHTLRSAGVHDDDIVLIGADDIAYHADNNRPGTVLNSSGDNVYAGATYDYGLSLDAQELSDIIVGDASDTLTTTLTTDASTNVVIYLVGHGNPDGLVVRGQRQEDDRSLFSPDMLRESLCTLRRENRVRRVLVVVEACYAGVFGEPEQMGLEAGCDDGQPLDGVLLVSASEADELSFAASYNRELDQWVSNDFSQTWQQQVTQQTTLLDTVRETWRRVLGSTVKVYNAPNYGDLSTLSAEEFLAPAAPTSSPERPSDTASLVTGV